MDKFEFAGVEGLDNKNTSNQANPISCLRADNFIINQKLGALVKRGGSSSYSVTGDIWGIWGYATDTASHKIPVIDTPIWHRRNGSTSYIEKLDWTTDTWSSMTLGTYTSFDTGNIGSAAQLNSVMAIAADRPAKITGLTDDVTRLGGGAPTAPTVAGGSAGSLTGDYYYVLTFYDSTSGWESSPSPVRSVVTVASKEIDLSAIPATATREDVDYVRIYRTIATAEAPFRYVGAVSLGTTTYTDTTADSALGEAAPVAGDHDPPPEGAYIVAAYKGRFWIAVDNCLYYSLPDDGTGVPLEYFSDARKEVFQSRVMGAIENPSGGMYVFQPPGFGVFEILGRFQDDNDFEVVVRFPSEGTYFHTSIELGGKENDTIAFWGSNGPTLITPSGISYLPVDPLGDRISPVELNDFNTSAFSWCRWDSALENFVFHISLEDAGSALWVEDGTTATVSWIDSSSGSAVTWEE